MPLKQFRKGLLGQFVIFGVVPSIFVVLCIIGGNTYLAAKEAQLSAADLATAEAARLANEVDARNGRASATANAMGIAFENGLFGNRASALAYLQSLANSNRDFGVFVAYDVNADGHDSDARSAEPGGPEIIPSVAMTPKGRFVPHVNRVEQGHLVRPMVNVDSLDFWTMAKQQATTGATRRVVISEPHVRENEYISEFVFPIVIDGKFVGVAGVSRTLALGRQHVKDSAERTGLNFMLLTDKDNFVAAAAGDATGDDKLRSEFEGLSGRPLDKTLWATSLRDLVSKTGEPSSGRALNPVTNVEDIHAVARVGSSGWKIVAEVPRGKLMRQVWDSMWPGLIVGAAGIAVMAALIVRTARRVVAEVRGSTIAISSTATQMASSSRQQEEVAQTFGSSSVEIAAAVREITATGSELLRKMEELSAAAGESAQNATQGRAGVQAMGSTMDGLAAATTNVAERLSAISEKASSINAIVDTITKVADQTNLLSVNAAIEAEKAGESGRGFLVVAREIRRLADQTASATLDIENMVRQMQGAVSGGVMEMDRFSEQVRRGVTNVGEVGNRLTQVIDQVGSVEGRFSEVTEGMQSQVQGAEQIRQAMDALAQNASRAREATGEFSQAAANLRESISSLRATVGGASSELT